MNEENFNTLWAYLIIDEFVKNNITYFCLSPGYRNAPLLHVLKDHSKTQKNIFIDERAAAYHALGYAKTSGKAAVLVCTSGTALANYYPAVVEAFKDHVPLVIMSADRPCESVLTDAHQTIDQREFYNRYTKFFLGLETPNEKTNPQEWLGQIDRGLYMAHSLQTRGPIHINCPFREPLAPIKIDREDLRKSIFYQMAKKIKNSDGPFIKFLDLSKLKMKIQMNDFKPSRGIIVVGKISSFDNNHEDVDEFFKMITQLSSFLQWPIHFDISSSLRHRSSHYWDWDRLECIQLLNESGIDTVWHFGDALLSKGFQRWMNSKRPLLELWRFQETFSLQDSSFISYTNVIGPLKEILEVFILNIQQRSLTLSTSSSTSTSLCDDPLLKEFQVKQKIIKIKVKKYLETIAFSYLSVSHAISLLIKERDVLYLGNSTPIRAFEAATVLFEKDLSLMVHRGVSGIEGLLAAATGASMALEKERKVTLVIGDLALIHDLNSLANLNQATNPIIIVVVNNYSGGLFSKLPIAQFPETLNPYISTPHSWNFEWVAKQFGIEYCLVKTQGDFEKEYSQAISRDYKVHKLIEVIIENDTDDSIYKNFYQILPLTLKV